LNAYFIINKFFLSLICLNQKIPLGLPRGQK